jgi:hypothetical protein
MSQDSKIAGDELTPSPLFNLHCHNRKDREHFYHDFHHHVRHCLRWFCFCMTLETLEKALDALKEIDEHVLARIHILCGLKGVGFMIAYIKRSARALTKRRTPIPANITFAGGNV